MYQQATSLRPLRILLVVMPQSPFNRSIWTGFLHGFQSLGHDVTVVDAAGIPDPAADANRPDLLLAVHGGNAPADSILAYRAAGVSTAVYLLDEPYEVDRSAGWARHYDRIFSVDQATVPIHSRHTQAVFLPLAYNNAIFSPDGPRIPSTILVLGSPFRAREEFLSVLRDRWGDLVTWVGPGWRQFSAPGQHYEQYILPADCARFYRGAEIVINIHRDSYWSHFGDFNRNRLEATHLNPRFWETAACKTLQLCSYRKDLDTFAPNCPSFRTADEFTNKLEYFIGNQKARDTIASKVYSRIKTHTYQARCRTIIDSLGLQPAAV
jgi:spore maturation protein CgeB